jgi:hypothetical protein
MKLVFSQRRVHPRGCTLFEVLPQNKNATGCLAGYSLGRSLGEVFFVKFHLGDSTTKCILQQTPYLFEGIGESFMNMVGITLPFRKAKG